MARLYANECFPFPIIRRLREDGHDVLTSFEAGQANQGLKDEAVIEFAVQLGRAVITTNRWHFVRLHRQSASHRGIVVCRDIPAQHEMIASHLLDALNAHPNLDGKLVRVYKDRWLLDPR